MTSPRPRPLSPHLQVYKPQITSTLSIFHRATGLVLSGGAFLMVIWLLCLASGPEAFGAAHAVATSWLGKIMIFGWTLCFSYHLLNGIRHMVWDTGRGMQMPQVEKSAYVVLIGSVALTVLIFLVA